jgi:catechol 2,3-dioxygenase-like lactoylglutathione lyase family enzyme
MTTRTIAHVAIVVRDYDEAIDYYTGVLGFELIEDEAPGPGTRWNLIEPKHASYAVRFTPATA